MKAQGLAAALQSEVFVLVRSWKTWLLITLPTLVSACHLLLIKANAASAQLQQTISGRPSESGADYAYGYLVDAFSTSLILIYLVFLAYGAFAFASDRDSGAIRHSVIRRSSRAAVLSAKVIVLHGMTVASCLLAFISAWTVCALLWDFGPVIEDGYELISVAEIHQEIRTGLVLALLPLPACLCLGMLLSVIANSALQAVSLALGISLLLDIFKGALGNIAPYLYINFQPSLLDNSYLSEVARIARGFSDILIDEDMVQLNYWIPIPQAIFLLVIALLWVRRKSL